MIFIPAWITNILLLGTCWLSGYQLSQLQRANPIPTLQFPMVLFCLLTVWMVALYNRVNPWLSLAFFLIAVINLTVMVRQHRMLPPKKPLE
jgi:Ca2+/Na+ antiporter